MQTPKQKFEVFKTLTTLCCVTATTTLTYVYVTVTLCTVAAFVNLGTTYVERLYL